MTDAQWEVLSALHCSALSTVQCSAAVVCGRSSTVGWGEADEGS